MSRKQARTKSTTSLPAANRDEDPLAYEMWLTDEAEHGPVEEREAAEDLLLSELQRRGPRKQPGSKTSRRKPSK
ncbi:MAG: hypothetical protein CV081_02050 [Nitrospira sp. LK265]|nr:hypothetical protein [Nitrospira sp. LK265]